MNFSDKTILQAIHENCDHLLPALKERKKELRITNQDIADHTGISADTVRKFFAGESKSPNVYNVMAMCIYMDLSLDTLLGNSQSIPAPAAPNKELEMEIHSLQTELKYAEKTDQMKTQTIKRLDILLISLSVMLIVSLATYLRIDIQIPDAGLFQSTHIHPLAIVIVLVLLAGAFMLIRYSIKLRKRIKESL